MRHASDHPTATGANGFRRSLLVGDRLFLPPDEDITEYFHVDRLVRSRIAACEVREYLLGEVSRQLLRTWAHRIGWPTLSLVLRRACWSISDW
jgi:hypothetical protein